MSKVKDPIVNCHVHLFNNYHVPPEHAKGILPWPLYKWARMDYFMKLYVKCNRRKYAERYEPAQETIRINKVKAQNRIQRNSFLKFVRGAFNLIVTIYVLLFLYEVLVESTFYGGSKYIAAFLALLVKYKLYFHELHWAIKTIFVAAIIAFIPAVRRQIWFLLQKFVPMIKSFPATEYMDLLERYVLIARFSSYGYETKSAKTGDDQRRLSLLFQKLRAQYPAETKFIVLPMDMKYMGAGKVHRLGDFHKQMEGLVKLTKGEDHGHQILPFIFIDPRRIREEDDFFKWKVEYGKVVLLECKVQKYLSNGCCGFKIYPALGYYPFDEDLLPVWAYAAQEGLPIMTHCVHGTIYSRDKITDEMAKHPVFKRSTGIEDAHDDTVIAPIDLLELRGIDFQKNYTHPLNYLCLLDDDLLREHLVSCQPRIQTLFEKGPDEKFRSLSQLKICLAHFGGVDEWKRHLEADNDQYNQDLNLHAESGLFHRSYYDNEHKRIQWTRVYAHWMEADWYTIICSMMLRYENVYADISYILHDPWIQPLLKKTIDHSVKKLGERVLFGTDFFVVRNHLSEKELYANMLAGLSEAQFDLIARTNPKHYLANTFHRIAHS
ncbi:MAG: amidohydrolase family protein [Flavobacteriales bacterium]|nr:amidohydrolase family protein [Flavobacteriales bacterium]